MALAFFTRYDYKFWYYGTSDFDGSDPGAVTGKQLRIPNMDVMPTVDVVFPDRSVGIRQVDDDDPYATQCGQEHLITVPPWEVHRTEIAELFRMAMQTASEADASPYSKIIYPHSTQPDFVGDGGHLCYLGAKHPGTSSSFLAHCRAWRSTTTRLWRISVLHTRQASIGSIGGNRLPSLLMAWATICTSRRPSTITGPLKSRPCDTPIASTWTGCGL